jgi:penicillin amidase
MRRWMVRGLLGLALLLILASVAGWLLMRGSLPQLEGSAALPSLSASVEIERDALGTVTLHASNRLDAVRALGFVHAQERYFEMDLMRRLAAGELAELFGERALPRDRDNRRHRLRARMPAHLAALPGEQRAELAAYADGVNAGLAALKVRPWSYLLLGVQPSPWREEDSLLVGLAMFFDLQDEFNQREFGLMQLREHLPNALVDLLAAPGTELDAPLFGEPWPALTPAQLQSALSSSPAAQAVEPIDPATIPGELGEPATASDHSSEDSTTEPPVVGSNNFAVSGALTADGRALVADDMHLGLRAPGIWFRLRLRYPDPQAPAGVVDASGASLPGTPVLIIGSTGHVAWGFTNSYGDWLDWVAVDFEDAERTRYRTPEGNEPVQVFEEVLKVHGGTSETLRVRETRWGPLLEPTSSGQELALMWTAHRPGAIDLGISRLLRAGNLNQAIDIAHSSGMPVQNLVVGDRSGRIGWTLMGRLPMRIGDCDPMTPLQPLQGCGWGEAWLPTDAVPRLIDPSSGRLWTANSRIVDAAGLTVVGNGGYDLGARQRQIRDALFARERFDESALLALQLDDRALHIAPWWSRLRAVLEAHTTDPDLRALEQATRVRPERASVDSVSYRAAREFRVQLIDSLQAHLLAPVSADRGKDWTPPRPLQMEAVAVAMLESATVMLPDGSPLDSAALQREAAQALAGEWAALGGEMSERSWGERNTSSICHPLAAGLPWPLRQHLCMPADPLAGDSLLPRVQGPSFGASQRMVVAPGREAEGLFQMPGGQSGHPLSPFWGSGHAAWVAGENSPFLPGTVRHRLQLKGTADAGPTELSSGTPH